MPRNLFLIIVLLLLLTPACRQQDSLSPPRFSSYKNNPVLERGKPGTWDELFVSAPQVVFYESAFYLFYMGGNEAGQMAVGLATSMDGFNFRKFEGNPVLAPDSAGFDAFTVGPGIILNEDSCWVMYYNCQELPGYSPGPSVGRAAAKKLSGPWMRSNIPVLTSGKKGEWDDGFILPCSVLKLKDGSYRMYYTGGREIATEDEFYIGMAVSQDGFTWKKYNDPSTTLQPFAESDPVFMTGKEGAWDEKMVWMANVSKIPGGFIMYYAGSNGKGDAIGYSKSNDGIHWERYPGNPVYKGKNAMDTKHSGEITATTNPFFLRFDTTCFLYYYVEQNAQFGNIGVATGK